MTQEANKSFILQSNLSHHFSKEMAEDTNLRDEHQDQANCKEAKVRKKTTSEELTIWTKLVYG